MHQAFSIREAVRFGWHKTRAHSGVLFQAMFALFALEIIGAMVDSVLGERAEAYLAHALLTVVSVILSAGFTLITLKLARGQHASWRQLIPPAPLVWTYFLASLLVMLIVVGGLILLIVPGIYLLLRFCMVSFAVIDGASVRESLRRSSKMTEGIKWRLLGFLLVMAALNIVGAALLVVGLLVSVPVTAIAFAHLYDKLKHRG